MEVIEYENLQKLNQAFFDAYLNQLTEMMQSGWFVLGSGVQNFEQQYAAFCDSKYCVGVANGLDAMVLALKSFDFPENAEVIVPSNTYIATILAIVNANMKPVLVEPDINTYNIDPNKIEEKITANTKAILAVHLYGKMCDMDSLLAITKKHNLVLIEDGAQSHGAKYKGKMSGTFGHFGAHSFYPTKNLGALGDAGALTTDDEQLAEKVLYLHNYGSKIKYHNKYIGFNSRLDEIQARFLSVKLPYLNAITEHKRRLANLYHEGLKSGFIKPVQHQDYFDVYHIFNIRHKERDRLRAHFLANGIKTEIHYPIPPHMQEAYINIFEDQHFPISEEIHKTTLSLPISYFHSENDIERVIEVANKF